MEWLSANWGNLLVGTALLAVVIAIVVNLIRRKRNGCSCGCDCGCGCCGKDSCSRKEWGANRNDIKVLYRYWNSSRQLEEWTIALMECVFCWILQIQWLRNIMPFGAVQRKHFNEMKQVLGYFIWNRCKWCRRDGCKQSENIVAMFVNVVTSDTLGGFWFLFCQIQSSQAEPPISMKCSVWLMKCFLNQFSPFTIEIPPSF